MSKYFTIESWASRLGYIVERTDGGYLWHLENEPSVGELPTAGEVVEAILDRIRSEYGGEE